MTPFDPDALLAMLLAFYPIVSGAMLAQARGERPEYFAGGVLFGSKGDKLRLPDGRAWDLIYASGGPIALRHWQALYIDPNAAPGESDPFALDEGPLVPVDDQMPLHIVGAGGSFEDLVTAHLQELGGSDGVLEAAGQSVATADVGARLDGSAQEYEDATANHVAIVSTFDSDTLDDVFRATGGNTAAIDTHAAQYEEPPPPDAPVVDPGDIPPDHGDTPPPQY